MKDVEFFWWDITDDWGRRRKSPCIATVETALQYWGPTATRRESSREVRSLPETAEELARQAPKTHPTDRTPPTMDSQTTGVIVELSRRNGKFIVQVDRGGHAVFALYDSIELEQWDRLSGKLRQVASETLYHHKKTQHFDAFGETGIGTLQECQRALRVPRVPDVNAS